MTGRFRRILVRAFELLFLSEMYSAVPVCMTEVPCKPRAVRIIKCLTTSVQLAVEMPQDFQGPRVTGFVVHNQLQLIRANLGSNSRQYRTVPLLTTVVAGFPGPLNTFELLVATPLINQSINQKRIKVTKVTNVTARPLLQC